MLEKLICKYCGKEFRVRNYRKEIAKFCSIKCRAKYHEGKYLGENSHKWKEEAHIKLVCKQCGKEYDKYLKGKDRSNFCSRVCVNRWMSENLTKEKRYNWNGGTTKRKAEGYWNSTCKAWRNAIFERDNYTCQWCGARSKKGETVYLEAHHIKLWVDYPELRFDLNNGVTLCRECHNTKGIHERGDSNR